MKLRLTLTLAVAAVFLAVGVANAGPITISGAAVGGGPLTGLHYDSLNWVANSPGTVQTNPTAEFTVALYPDAQAVTGAASGQYAAPYIYNSNGTLFGDPTVEGPDATGYLTTGSTNAAGGARVDIQFFEPQQYFGLLWGSVDTYNTLTFYLGGVQVAQFTGSSVTAAATGDQGRNGTFYVNFTGGPFDQVVAVSSEKAFEFDNLAFAVPDGGTTLALLGGALMALGLVRRRLRG